MILRTAIVALGAGLVGGAGQHLLGDRLGWVHHAWFAEAFAVAIGLAIGLAAGKPGAATLAAIFGVAQGRWRSMPGWLVWSALPVSIVALTLLYRVLAKPYRIGLFVGDGTGVLRQMEERRSGGHRIGF